MSENERILPVDAVRGIAMVFVGVSHISFYLLNDSERLWSVLLAIGFLASPAFLLMSGVACGYQLARSPTSATALRIVDRGLFTFLIGHFLVTASLVYLVPSGTAFEHVVITDTIGLLLCMAPLLTRAQPRALLWIGVTTFVLSSTAGFLWSPSTRWQELVGALLLAINLGDIPDVGWVTPTLPYLGIFLIGVGVGKAIFLFRKQELANLLSRRLAMAGSAAVLSGLSLDVLRHFDKPLLVAHLAHRNWADMLLNAMTVRHDAPPTIAYGLFYCGITIALLGFLGLPRALHAQSLLARTTRWAAVIGRASFVSYLVQQWLIDFLPLRIGFDSWLTPVTAPLYLLLTAAVMFAIAKHWGGRNANRYMTLGLNPPSRHAPETTADAASTGSRLPATARPGARLFGRVAIATGIAALAILLNVVAHANADQLTPRKLALVPVNPDPWYPLRFAGHRDRFNWRVSPERTPHEVPRRSISREGRGGAAPSPGNEG